MANALAGEVALVTGGGRGIGTAIARTLASEGAKVVVMGRSEQSLAETVSVIQQSGGQARAATGDVTSAQEVQHVVAEAERLFGPVTVLVNNAASFVALGLVWEVEPATWWRELEVNLFGSFLLMRAVLPSMIKQKHGCIINLSTNPDLVLPGASAYVSSKTALLRLTECVAAGAKDYGITVFAVSPGLVETDMTRYLAESEAGKQAVPWATDALEKFAVSPQLVANLCVSLASGGADGLTGRFIDVQTHDLEDVMSLADEAQERDLHVLRLRT